jgi:hypothetical protein
MRIEQFRKSYPQYKDVNDVDLARALHKKYYSSTPYEDFSSQFLPEGIAQTSPVFPPRRRIESPGISIYGIRDTITHPPETPPLFKSLWGEAPQAVGGEVGAIAGGIAGTTLLGPGPGTVVGALGGAFIGGMGGKGYQQAYKMFKGTSDAPTGFGEIYAQQARAGVEEFAAEAGGRAIARTLKGGMFGKAIIEKGRAMQELMRRRGSLLTLGQVTDAWVTDSAEAIAEASIFGGRRVKAIKYKPGGKGPGIFRRIVPQKVAIKEMGEEIADAFTSKAARELDPDAIGTLVNDIISGRNRTFMTQAKALYGNVDKLTEAAKVDISSLKGFATEVLEGAQELRGIGASEAGDTLLRKVQKLGAKTIEEELGEEVVEVGNEISFKAAQELRSRLLKEETSLAATKDKARGIAKKLVSLLDTAIDNSGKNLSPEALQAFRTANRFYKQGKEKFANRVIRNLIDTVEKRGEPEKIIPYIFQNKAVSRLKKVKTAVDSSTWDTLKAAYVTNWLETATDPATGVITGTNLLNQFKRMGDPALNTIFKGPELRELKLFAETAALTQSSQAIQQLTTATPMLVKLVQAGAVVDLMTVGAFPRGAKALIFGPEVLSQITTRPGAIRWLTEGLKTPAGTPEAAALGARLVSALRRAQREVQRKKGVVFPEEMPRLFHPRTRF